MVNVKIDENDLLHMLVERIKYWTDEEDVIQAYAESYDADIQDGLFDGAELDIMGIVDNDWVNWTDVYADEKEALENYECNSMEELQEESSIQRVFTASNGLVIVRVY